MIYRLEMHPEARRELRQIGEWIADQGGTNASRRVVKEIERVMFGLVDVPHKGSLRNEIAPGIRAIPAAENAVITFAVDDATRTVMIYVISYGGADWIRRVRNRLG